MAEGEARDMDPTLGTSTDEVLAVIPSRYGSHRLPGKALADLDGRPVIAWVVAAALRARRVGRVLVATDHAEILEAARVAGADAVITDGDHATGTDRIGEAIRDASESVILNVQGDEPLVEPAMIDRLVELLDSDREASVSTLAAPCPPDAVGDPNVVKVVCDGRGRAIYFSRAPIPGSHPGDAAPRPTYLRHVGLYGFQRSALRSFLDHGRTEIERVEGLEQLRFFELDIPIAVGLVEATPPGIDTAADLEECRRILRSRGG